METFYFFSGMLLTSVGVIISAFILGILKVASMQKQINNLHESLRNTEHIIEHNMDTCMSRDSDIIRTIDERTDVIHREIESRFTEVYDRIDGAHSYVDSRFDKWENKHYSTKLNNQVKKEVV